MTRVNPAFAIWGYGSENVFRTFAPFLESRGYEVIHLPDPALDRRQEVERLATTPFILLTSAHFTRDPRILGELYPDISVGNSFLELLAYCKPLLSVFYPHDLSTPLVLNEPSALCSFDLVLWPLSFFGYQPRPRRVINVGWVGYRGTYIPPADRQYDSAFLFSDLCNHEARFGIEGTFRKLAPVLECGTAIKFPKWPGHEEFEEYFRRRGAAVISADTSAGDVILDSRVIVSNSVSSITLEASYMGTPVINLIEDYLPAGMQKAFLSGLPGCSQCSYADFRRHLSTPPSPFPPRVERFDDERVLKVILDELERNTTDEPGLRPECPPRPHRIGIEFVAAPPAELQRPIDAARENRVKPNRRRMIDRASPGTSGRQSASDAVPSERGTAPSPATSDEELELALAIRLLERNETEKAFPILHGLVNAGTTLWQPYFHISKIAAMQNEDDIAVEFLGLAANLEAPPGEAHRALAARHLSANRPLDALDVLSAILRHSPQDYEALDMLRRALGALPELDAIRWARLLTDIRFKTG